jgi:hypothetical protein
VRTLNLVAVLLVLAAVSPAPADLPLPSNLKYVTPRVRFDGLDKHADHAFFLKYHSGQGNPYASPPRCLEVKNAEVFEMAGGRRIAGAQLFAVPREEAEKLRAKDPTLGWLNDKTPGLKASVPAPSTVAPKTTREVPVTAYRVAINGEKLGVETVKEKRSEAAPENRLRLLIVGTALALSLSLLGVWLVRRRDPGVA